MSMTRVDQQLQSSSTRRSSLVVNLSSIKKRSSVTTLMSTSSSTLGSKQTVSQNSTCFAPTGNPFSYSSFDESNSCMRERQDSGSSIGFQSTRGDCLASPLSAPPSLATKQPSYRIGQRELSMNSELIGSFNSPADDYPKNTSKNIQVVEIHREVVKPSQTTTNLSGQEQSADDEVNKKERNSPEPIVEVKHTSSSSSECEDSRKLVRRRTVRRYHRAFEEGQEDTKSSSARSTTSLIISSDKDNNNNKEDNLRREDSKKSHYRTRQIGALHGQSKQQQQQQTSKTSSSSSSTSKIAKCSITTNRKSTTSHHRELISESSSSSSSLKASSSTSTKEEEKKALVSSTSTSTGEAMLRESSFRTELSPSLSQSSQIVNPINRSLHVNNGLFEGTKRSIEVKQEEESSVRHSESFSSTTSMGRGGNLRKSAALSSSSAASEAAMLTAKHTHNGTSADLTASSSRLFQTSASVVVSGSDSTSKTSRNLDLDGPTNNVPFLNSDTLFSSPDVKTLVKEIGTDFAELELALSSTAGNLAPINTKANSLSTRLFGGKRLLSPISSSPQYPALTNSGSGHNLFDDTSRSLTSGIAVNNNSLRKTSSASYSQLKSLYGSSFSNLDNSPVNERSSGDRIKELLTKAQNHVDQMNRPSTLALTGPKVNSESPDSNEISIEQVEKRKSCVDSDNKLQANRCKTVMTESIERIDQRMSDLCKKLNNCGNPKDAIDLLKVMIQMIEKAWSVPVCGDDLGFKLCNSLREAGGLDTILNIINDSDDLTLPSCSNSIIEQQPDIPEVIPAGSIESLQSVSKTGDQSQATGTTTKQPLRLNLSKICQSSSSLKQPTTKDSDSDAITSDLGLDSTSVDSLIYVSASTQAGSSSHNDLDQLSAGIEEETEQFNVKKEEEELQKKDSIETEDDEGADVDLEKEEVFAADSEQDEDDSELSKEEVVFLSAKLLSQCLTLDNRDHIVNNGWLNPVIKLACTFTTMKSIQSHRLLSRSKVMRQSSNAISRQASSASQHSNLQKHILQHVPDFQQPNKQTSGIIQSPSDGDNKHSDHNDTHAIIGTEILQHLFKHSEETCSKMIFSGGLQAILYGCRSSNIETLRHCASALANLALYGGSDSQQTMIKHKAHVWLFPLAFNEDDNIQYYACLAIVVLVANQEIEADVLKSSTLNLVEPFVTSHEPRKFAESTTSHIHGQSANWLLKLIPLLESKREEARNLACFHFAMEAYIKREQGQTHVFREIGAVEPLKKVGSSPIAIASKFACQALRLIGEKEPHKLTQQVPLWTCEDVAAWVTQVGFEKFKSTFIESGVDGDLLLQLDEEMLKIDIGVDNGIIRRRFIRELANLKRIADYSSVDKTGLCSLLSASGQDFVQYVYPLVHMGVSRENLHLLDCEQLLKECKISNSIHRMKLAHTIRDLQEKMAIVASSSEFNSTDGQDQKTLDVFVSYRRATGSQLASLLKVHLQLRGFSVFIDVERLEAGKFDNNLLDSIKTAKNFILVLSPNALDRCIGDHECKDWVHKEIVAALASNCNIIPIMDNFHWPDPDQLPEDMRSITYFNGVRWIHDYQDACVDKVERFIRGEINNGGVGCQSISSAQSSLQRLPAGTYSSTPSIVATPSLANFPSGSGGTYSSRSPFDGDHHPLSLAIQHMQHSQSVSPIRR